MSTTWHVDFSGASVLGGSIADGEYRLAISPLRVTDANGLHLQSAPEPPYFFRLLGDSDGNGTVNNLDIADTCREARTTSAAPDYEWLPTLIGTARSTISTSFDFAATPAR